MSALPEAVRVIVEDIYAQGIAHSFLIAVPFAVISLIAIIFLPNKPLTRMTTTERIAAGEADLATVSTAEGMAALAATGSVRTRMTDAASRRVRCAPTVGRTPLVSITMTESEAREARTEAVRALEAEFGELINRIRRILAENAQRVSPGMLPGAYKVFTTIVRRESVTLSALAEALMADKGQISRTVRELEELGLDRAHARPGRRPLEPALADPEGLERLAAARRAAGDRAARHARRVVGRRHPRSHAAAARARLPARLALRRGDQTDRPSYRGLSRPVAPA